MSRQPRAGRDRRTPQEFLRRHRRLAGALQFENPYRAIPAADAEAIVQQFARSPRTIGSFAAQNLDARRLLVHDDLAPRARKRRQSVDMAKHSAGWPGPVDPRLRLLDLGGIGDAFVALPVKLQVAA